MTSAWNGAKVPSGVRRLDDLLDGGMPPCSATLVYGPPFIGKEVLTRMFLLSGIREGVPGVLVLTGAGSSDARRLLAAMEPGFAAYERAGLVHFIDAYSRSIGAEEDDPATEYVDGPLDLNRLSLAVNNAQSKFLQDHPSHRLVFDSVSALIAYSNPQTTFRFLQVLLGKAKRAGATSMCLLDQGMHSDAEVQTIKHLMDGVIEIKGENAKTFLHIEGIGLTENRGWVEYRFTDKSLEITGSFAAGRIR